MEISQSGLNKIKIYEALRLKPYLDSNRVCTIGYGTTYYPDGIKVTLKDQEITIEEALSYLESYCNKIAYSISKVITVDLKQNQIDALISLVYNIGVTNFTNSGLLKQINSDPYNYMLVEKHWLAWNKSGGKIVVGLENRRKEEFGNYKN